MFFTKKIETDKDTGAGYRDVELFWLIKNYGAGRASAKIVKPFYINLIAGDSSNSIIEICAGAQGHAARCVWRGFENDPTRYYPAADRERAGFLNVSGITDGQEWARPAIDELYRDIVDYNNDVKAKADATFYEIMTASLAAKRIAKDSEEDREPWL
jgi:hypothetical protein